MNFTKIIMIILLIILKIELMEIDGIQMMLFTPGNKDIIARVGTKILMIFQKKDTH